MDNRMTPGSLPGHPGASTAARTIQDIVAMAAELPGRWPEAFRRMFDVDSGLHRGGDVHRVTRVRNRWTGELTTFDETRKRRGPSGEVASDLRRQCETPTDCWFCKPSSRRNLLARPAAGRWESCTYFPPSAVFSPQHCLVFPDSHNPLDFTPRLLNDVFSCGTHWADRTLEAAERAQDDNPLPVFFFIAWNVLSGSVVHGHCQLTLTGRFPEGGVGQLAGAWRNYGTEQGDLFDDLIGLHSRLGLATSLGSSTAFASLTPVKEREVWIIRPPGDQPAAVPPDLRELLGTVLRRLSETAEAPCPALNIALAFPPLRPDPDWCNFPLVARVVDRGWPLLGVSDWGAMEMYGTRVVAMDPFTVASQVFG